MEIFYSEKAAKSLKRIRKGNMKCAKMIIDTIEKYAENVLDNFDIKYLKGKLGDFKRLRVGDYRIIFDDKNNILNIYNIKHRKDIYND